MIRIPSMCNEAFKGTHILYLNPHLICLIYVNKHGHMYEDLLEVGFVTKNMVMCRSTCAMCAARMAAQVEVEFLWVANIFIDHRPRRNICWGGCRVVQKQSRWMFRRNHDERHFWVVIRPHGMRPALDLGEFGTQHLLELETSNAMSIEKYYLHPKKQKPKTHVSKGVIRKSNNKFAAKQSKIHCKLSINMPFVIHSMAWPRIRATQVERKNPGNFF